MRRNFGYLAMVFAFGLPLLVAFWYLVVLNSDNASPTTGVVEEPGHRLYLDWGTGHGDDGKGALKA